MGQLSKYWDLPAIFFNFSFFWYFSSFKQSRSRNQGPHISKCSPSSISGMDDTFWVRQYLIDYCINFFLTLNTFWKSILSSFFFWKKFERHIFLILHKKAFFSFPCFEQKKSCNFFLLTPHPKKNHPSFYLLKSKDSSSPITDRVMDPDFLRLSFPPVCFLDWSLYPRELTRGR